jgi:hypothetical protein
MSSSWKLRASSIVFAAAVLAAFLGVPRPAAAAGCPTTPVGDHGGTHWCYTHDATKGNVHLWTPPGYDAGTAVTVIYIHGLDTGGNGPDKCLNKRPYVDCIWDASDHDIVGQFAASGVNALFVAIEGQIKSAASEPLRWASITSLFSSISSKGKIAPPQRVTVMGHSGGMYTARALWADARVDHVVSLDWVAGSLKNDVTTWFQKGDRKLTLLGGSTNQQAIMDDMAKSLLCTNAGSATALSQAEIDVKCLNMRSGSGHMGVVFRHTFMPPAIKRSSGIAAGGGAGPGPLGAAPGTVTRPPNSGPVEAPRLEVPIPGLELSSAIRGAGEITIPWLAQYVAGTYAFLLAAAGMVAAVMMVVGGFQYLTSAGDKGKLGAGKQKIVNALTGLVLAFGSYTLLYAINPNLVAFDGLKISDVQSQIAMDTANGSNEGGLISVTAADPGTSTPSPDASLPGGKPTALCNSQASCKSYCDTYFSDPGSLPKSAPGMASPSDVQVIPKDIPGVNGFGNSTSPATIALLRKVGPMFAADGFKLAIGSAYRDLLGQFRLACNAYRNGRADKVGRTIANPGGSFHGIGFAIDVTLWKDGKQVTMAGDSDLQQTENPAEAKYLAETMLKAGFRRLNNEIWHFEPANAPATGCRCYKIEECSMPPNVRC